MKPLINLKDVQVGDWIIEKRPMQNGKIKFPETYLISKIIKIILDENKMQTLTWRVRRGKILWDLPMVYPRAVNLITFPYYILEGDEFSEIKKEIMIMRL